MLIVGTGVLVATYDLGDDKMYGHVKAKRKRTRFLECCRCLQTLYPPEVLGTGAGMEDIGTGPLANALILLPASACGETTDLEAMLKHGPAERPA